MKTIRHYFLMNSAILIVGIALSILAILTINTSVPFMLSLVSGLLGVTLTFMAVSLFIDLNEIRNLKRG